MKIIKVLSLVVGAIILSAFMHTDRNVIKVLANTDDELYFEYEKLPLSKLTDTLKIVIANKDNDPSFPEKMTRELFHFGKTEISKAVVSIACDRGTSYEFYIKVQNEVERAYNELRNELSLAEFGKTYEQLDKVEKKAIDSFYPKRISEAEPRKLYRN